ncbi:MAG: iron-sulfur cluster assembly accessory protein [Candidatus Hydrogenedentota bacterium]
MSIAVSEKAASQVQKLMEQEKLPSASSGLRVAVKGGGCSGFSYSLSLAEAPTEKDQVFESGGVRVFVDPKSYLYLSGMTLDFQDGLMGKGFVFNNPNATKTCGCGSSFGV